ncbi:MAG: endolytic transglycosylase MltG [Clostridia bacterium]|nr:endolytic transglycosylase MltG [Clostridia bacterium]
MEEKTNKKAQNNKEKRKARRSTAWNIIRPVLVIVLSVSATLGALYVGGSYVYENYIMPVDENDPTPIEVVIPSGAGTSTIGKILYDANIISSKAVFKIYVDFLGKSSSMRAGTYILSKNMDIASIVDIICTGNPARATMNITITEGMTIQDIANMLVTRGVIQSASDFTEVADDPELFLEYACIAALEDIESRIYALEGYMFPDTYEIYTDASPESIINKLLVKFHSVFSKEHEQTASELGMTVDEIMVIASLIEAEAKLATDFDKVAAVIYNRLEAGMKLEFDSTITYITGINSIYYTDEQLDIDSPYNTYKNMGLPPGAICNPSRRAILAALAPNEEYIGEYFYFCLKDIATGELVFAKTYEEHLENVALYSPNW